EGSGDVLAAHIHVPLPRMSAIAPGVSPKLEAFVQRLLAKSPAERFQSCDEVVRAIDALNSTLGTSSHVAVPRAAPTPGTALTTITTLSVATEQRHASPATSRSRRIVIALGVAALASIAVVLTLVRVRGETGPVPDRAPEIERAPSREQPDASRPVLDPMPPPAPPADAGVFDAGVEQGAIEISSSPAGADVLIDGKRVGRTPYRAQRAMSAGEITLVIDLAGYQKRTVTVDGSVPIRQAFKLEPKRQPRGSRPSRDDSVNPFSN
ncbi:MAG TPA: PEGA domain-containing protein, partial [Kofleriaceae bacterium]|nr:PEGA domain-containing protein [Kofleriaceae bacterium]